MSVDELAPPTTPPRMVEIFADWSGSYRWRFIGTDGRTLHTSETLFPTRAGARQSAQLAAHQAGVESIVDDDD